MGLPLREKGLIILDLLKTVFNGDECHRLALSAAHKKCVDVAEVAYDDLDDAFHQATLEVCSMYRSGLVAWEDRDENKVRRAFRKLDLEDPASKTVDEFLVEYRAVYADEMRQNRSVVEALVRLREQGYKLCLVADGLTREEEARAEALGVRHLVDGLFASEETRHPKADPRSLRFIVDRFGASQFADRTSVVVGARSADIIGVSDAELSPIVYDPEGVVPQPRYVGKTIPAIRHLSYLLGALDVASPFFSARFARRQGVVVMDGFGVDVVTERRVELHATANDVRRLFDAVAVALVFVANEKYIDAMCCLERMIRIVAEAALHIDAGALFFEYPGRREGRGTAAFALPESDLRHRTHSVYAEYAKIAFPTPRGNEEVVVAVGTRLQEHFQHLMMDDPLSAMRRLRSAMILLSRAACARQSTNVSGAGIEVLAFDDDRDELREMVEQGWW